MEIGAAKRKHFLMENAVIQFTRHGVYIRVPRRGNKHTDTIVGLAFMLYNKLPYIFFVFYIYIFYPFLPPRPSSKFNTRAPRRLSIELTFCRCIVSNIGKSGEKKPERDLIIKLKTPKATRCQYAISWKK